MRSSATAEDLPDLSFAGQQDTYLNVSGQAALLEAVRSCWGSLWTARAIGYRAHNGLPQDGVSLAVVVQAMVQAEAAGVLFTANPLTGRRTESAIDATLGLGEALVSGQVEPDHYLVESASGRIVAKQLGAKVGPGAGGDRRSLQALPDGAIAALAGLGERVEAYFGIPQDIEWTWAAGELALVQSRPITSLYPLPAGMEPAGPLRVLGSFGAFQGMLDPLTPLGSDALRSLAASTACLLDYDVTWETQGVFRQAGERLWIDLTALLRNGFGRRLLHAALGQVEPSVREALLQVWDDPRLGVTSERPSVRTIRTAARLLLPLAGRLALALARPEAAQREAAKSVGRAIRWYETLSAEAHSLEQRLALLDEIAVSIRKFLLPGLFPRFVPGMASLYRLYRVCDELPAGRQVALELLRGLPNNVTTEMDLALWEAARRIQRDAAANEAFLTRAQPQPGASIPGKGPAARRAAGARRIPVTLRDARARRDRHGPAEMA